ncbi:hypothetical protein AMECASPLE_037627 [Ameca splendens]|uniref:Uncharacterized protein n=1 Tax=Ameca splendens TaxID=208324 RepID=A0ABV0YJ41_9TELE
MGFPIDGVQKKCCCDPGMDLLFLSFSNSSAAWAVPAVLRFHKVTIITKQAHQCLHQDILRPIPGFQELTLTYNINLRTSTSTGSCSWSNKFAQVSITQLPVRPLTRDSILVKHT